MPDDSAEPQAALEDARENLNRVRENGFVWPDTSSIWVKAHEAVLAAERNLAAARGEPYALPIDPCFVPEASVSAPVLLQSDDGAILTFSAMRALPDGRRERAGVGVVEIDRCLVTKFGYPNDEALPGHPLHGKGLDACAAYEVANSPWPREITRQNRVAFPNTPDSALCHFIITFHDSTFECVARSLRPSLSDRPFAEVFDEIQRRLLGSAMV